MVNLGRKVNMKHEGLMRHDAWQVPGRRAPVRTPTPMGATLRASPRQDDVCASQGLDVGPSLATSRQARRLACVFVPCVAVQQRMGQQRVAPRTERSTSSRGPGSGTSGTSRRGSEARHANAREAAVNEGRVLQDGRGGGAGSWQHSDVVVCDESARVLQASPRMLRAGVRIGMRQRDVSRLAARPRVVEVSRESVLHYVQRLAHALEVFSPHVEVEHASLGLLYLDPEGMELLYGDVGQWAKAVQSYIRGWGVDADLWIGFQRHALAMIACAQTPHALREEYRSVAASVPCVFASEEEERRALGGLSLSSVLHDSRAEVQARKLGLVVVDDVLRVPASTLAMQGNDALQQLRARCTEQGPRFVHDASVEGTLQLSREFDEPVHAWADLVEALRLDMEPAVARAVQTKRGILSMKLTVHHGDDMLDVFDGWTSHAGSARHAEHARHCFATRAMSQTLPLSFSTPLVSVASVLQAIEHAFIDHLRAGSVIGWDAVICLADLPSVQSAWETEMEAQTPSTPLASKAQPSKLFALEQRASKQLPANHQGLIGSMADADDDRKDEHDTIRVTAPGEQVVAVPGEHAVGNDREARAMAGSWTDAGRWRELASSPEPEAESLAPSMQEPYETKACAFDVPWFSVHVADTCKSHLPEQQSVWRRIRSVHGLSMPAAGVGDQSALKPARTLQHKDALSASSVPSVLPRFTQMHRVRRLFLNPRRTDTPLPAPVVLGASPDAEASSMHVRARRSPAQCSPAQCSPNQCPSNQCPSKQCSPEQCPSKQCSPEQCDPSTERAAARESVSASARMGTHVNPVHRITDRWWEDPVRRDYVYSADVPKRGDAQGDGCGVASWMFFDRGRKQWYAHGFVD